VKRAILTALMQPRNANGPVSSVTGSLPHLAGILLMLPATVLCPALQCFSKRSGSSCWQAQLCIGMSGQLVITADHLRVPEGFAINADVQDVVMPVLAMHICSDLIMHQCADAST